MTKVKSRQMYALIAAIIYTAYVIYYIFDICNLVINHINFIMPLSEVVLLLGLIAMAAALFMRSPKITRTAAGAYAVLSAYALYSEYTRHLHFASLSCNAILPYTAVVVLVILALKGKALVKKIWFIPAAISLLAYILFWIMRGYFALLSANWTYMLVGIAQTAALLFVGLWIKTIDAPSTTGPVNEYAVFDPQTAYAASEAAAIIGGADKLKQYKELLDSGTITQEEFDAKKKQILGL